MKEVHLLKFKWLWNICGCLEPRDSFFISTTLPTLQKNAYGLDKYQIEKLDSVYDKYKPIKEKLLQASFSVK